MVQKTQHCMLVYCSTSATNTFAKTTFGSPQNSARKREYARIMHAQCRKYSVIFWGGDSIMREYRRSRVPLLNPNGRAYVRTASFHNFKSQNFKLSVSNPKGKYVAYLSVLSRISNCQGLGRKNNFEILKTDRTRPLGQGDLRVCPPVASEGAHEIVDFQLKECPPGVPTGTKH